MDWTGQWTGHERTYIQVVNIDRWVQRQQQSVVYVGYERYTEVSTLLIFNVNVWFWFHSVRKIVENSCRIRGFCAWFAFNFALRM